MQKKCTGLILLLIKKCCLSLHYNGDNSYLFVNGIEITKFKAKNSELIKHSMCLGNLYLTTTENTKLNTLDYMEMFMTLVLIIALVKMIKY